MGVAVNSQLFKTDTKSEPPLDTYQLLALLNIIATTKSLPEKLKFIIVI